MAEDEIEEASKLPPDGRLESLNERLDHARRRRAEKASGVRGDPNYRAGQLVLSQLVGGPLGGAVIGWVLDQWLGTKPWLMLILLFIGFAGGVINIFRISSKRAGSDRHAE
jgi:ATP synthase protein I